jgi:flotillin
MAAISDLTVISTDGASQLSRQVGSNLSETLEVVKRTTGVDVTELLRNLTGQPGRPTTPQPTPTPTTTVAGTTVAGPDAG